MWIDPFQGSKTETDVTALLSLSLSFTIMTIQEAGKFGEKENLFHQ